MFLKSRFKFLKDSDILKHDKGAERQFCCSAVDQDTRMIVKCCIDHMVDRYRTKRWIKVQAGRYIPSIGGL